MEVAESVLLPLAAASRLKQDRFGRLLELLLECLVLNGNVPAEFGSVSDPYEKELGTSLMALMLEVIAQGSSADTLHKMLLDNSMPVELADQVRCAFLARQSELRAGSQRIGGPALPHLVDVNWRLEYVLKSNMAECLDEPQLHMTLLADGGGSETDGEPYGSTSAPTNFSCKTCYQKYEKLTNVLKKSR